MYINYINMFDYKHDAACVISLIESRLNCINRILTDITRGLMQSDNYRSYKNSIVPFFIHVFIISTIRFVSHETFTYILASTGMIDGNFGTMIKIVHA